MVYAETVSAQEHTSLLGNTRGLLVAALAAVALVALLLFVRPLTSITQRPAQLTATTGSRGFYDPQTDAQGNHYVWTQGDAATAFVVASHRPLQVIVAARSAAIAGGPDAPIHILLNDRDVLTIRPDPHRSDFQTFAVDIPGSDLSTVTVGLSGPTFQPPKDRRTLGTMVQRIAIHETWPSITQHLWLYWAAPMFAMLAVVLLWDTRMRIARRPVPTLAGYGAVACCAVASGCMLVALILLTRLGQIDQSKYYVWWFSTLALLLLFGIATLALPLGGPGRPSACQRIAQSAIICQHRVAFIRLRDSGLVILPFLLAFRFFGDAGTKDAGDKLKWMQNMRQYGVIHGYRLNENVYPPFTQVILAVFEKLARLVGWSDLFAFKLSLAVFFAITSLVLLLWTRSAPLTAAMQLGLTINAMALGYTDIYFAPTLLIALWALRTRKLLLFSVAFAITCLIKWQPAVITPFILLYVVRTTWAPEVGWCSLKTVFVNVVLPGCLFIAGVLAIFGNEPIATLGRAMGERYLSGNALNVNWIITDGLHVFRPDRFGALADGFSGSVKLNHDVIFGVPSRILFILFYGYALYRLVRSRMTYEDALFWTLIGYFAYFLFNTSVHENHLFPAVILAAVLFFIKRHYGWLFVTTLLVLNVNLVLFYGLNGVEMAPTPFVGEIDAALIISVVNVLLFVWLLIWQASGNNRVNRGRTLLTITAIENPGASVHPNAAHAGYPVLSRESSEAPH